MSYLESRPNFIDLAKVLGIYSVLVGHYVYFFDVPFVEYSDMWYVTHFVTLFHMPLFFFISGMLWSDKEKNLKAFWGKQIKTLFVPYFLFCLIIGFLYYLPDVMHGTSLKVLLKYFLGIWVGGDCFKKVSIYPVGPIWFVYALFWIKILFFLIQKIENKFLCNMTQVVVAMLGFAIACLNRDILPFRIDSIFVGMFFFMVGKRLKPFTMNVFKSPKRTFWIAIGAVLCLCVFNYLLVDNSIRQGLSINACYFGKWPVAFFFSGLIGTFAVLAIARIMPMCGRGGAKFILELSNGMIVTLASHKMIFIAFSKIFYYESVAAMFLVSCLCLVITYIFILLIAKYCPVLIGYRKYGKSI